MGLVLGPGPGRLALTDTAREFDTRLSPGPWPHWTFGPQGKVRE